MRKPRILLVAARIPPDVGGVELHVAEVAPRLAAAGFDVAILATDRSGERPAHGTLGEVPVRLVRAYPRDRDWYLAPGLPGAIAAARPDLVHVQGYHTLVAPLAMATSIALGVPFVVSFHTGGHPSELRNRARPLQRLLLRPFLRRAARLVPVSRFERELVRREQRLARRRFTLVRNGSSLPPPRAAAAEVNGTDGHGANGAGPLVISVGRVERYKGQRRLVAAWPAVLRQLPGARLRIVGSGSDQGAVRAEVDRLGLADHVEMTSLPAEDRQAMADALGDADLYALLSEFEAHPVAVMEALGAGTPALVARTSGLTELVEDGLAAGIPVSASAAEIADAIAGTLERGPRVDPARLPTWDDTARQLASIYREVLGRAP